MNPCSARLKHLSVVKGEPMIRFILVAFLAATPAHAQDVAFAAITAEGHVLDEYLWTARPLVIFADNEHDPRFVDQMAFINERAEDLALRDVIVITDTDPSANSAIREALRPRGFMLVLIGKDGLIYLRKPTPWKVRELTRSIDKMPIRQQEMRDVHTR